LKVTTIRDEKALLICKEKTMPQHPTPLAIVAAYLEAWTTHDIAAAASYLADDLVFDGPILHTTSAEAFISGPGGLAAFAQNVIPSSLRMIAAFGDRDQLRRGNTLDFCTGDLRQGEAAAAYFGSDRVIMLPAP
jgi:hypothetical protein